MGERQKEPREVFGPFLVFERLGVGGTASVFRAMVERDDGRKVEVSLKRLHPHLAADARIVKEFVHEAHIARLMHHRNISRFYQVGRLGDDYFIATEYIAGTDLGKLLQNAYQIGRPPRMGVVLTLLVQLCDALSYAHDRVDDDTGERLDFVHRDISPSNLIIAPDGLLKVIDMGIAKARTSEIRTDTGIIKGKLGYMAPEVVAGRSADRRADIFAVGVVAWELLTARRLFRGANEAETIELVQLGATQPPSRHNAACPPQIDTIVMRALHRQAARRWPSAGAMRAALMAAASTLHEPVSKELVAQWLAASTHPATGLPMAAPPTPTPTPNEQVTTQVRYRTQPTMPVRPRKFPAGTDQVAAVADDEPTERTPTPQPVAPPLPPPAPAPRTPTPPAAFMRPMRRRSTISVAPLGRLRRISTRRLLSTVLGGSVVVNIVLTIGLITAHVDDSPPPAVPVPVPIPMPEETARTKQPASTNPLTLSEAPAKPGRSRRAAPARKSAPAPAPAPAPAHAHALMLPYDSLTRTRGRLPRSRSTTGPFLARVCLDDRGKVDTVEVLDAPEHLHHRIQRALRHWRFRLPARARGASSVCTIVGEHFEAWR